MAINTTISTAADTTYLNKTYYDRNLLENAKTKFVHQLFGQKRNIPKNNGKTVEYRKHTLFTPDVEALTLTEGVTPNGQSLEQTKVEATVRQFGAFVEVSDTLNLTAFDDVIDASTELLGEQMGTVIEWFTRDAMCATTNVQYAGGKEHRYELTSSEVLTIAEIRKAVRTLKKNKARMFTKGENGVARKPHYICICSPDATYDLQSDEDWKKVSQYQDKEAIYTGEIGMMYSVVFVESTEAKVYKQSVLNAVSANTSSSSEFVLKNTPTAEAVSYLSTGGNKIKIGGTEYTLAATGSYTAATKTVKLSTAVSLSADAIVCSEDAGKLDASTYKAPDVHSSLVFGENAYGVIDIDGSGTMETIIKPAGSSGTSDPLNQRSTIGAKVMAYTAKVLEPLWIIALEHCVS